jgi:RimJ/RimL family protein N-acetyltransferase
LSVALAAAVPRDWPPDFYDDDDLRRMRALLADAANQGWALYYLIQRTPTRTLFGIAGFSGPPSADRSVEIGYSLMPSHHGHGFATEAVGELLRFAFADPSVKRVIAETYPHLPASIRVLIRTGFRLADDVGRGGGLRYALERSAYTAAAGEG